MVGIIVLRTAAIHGVIRGEFMTIFIATSRVIANQTSVFFAADLQLG